MDELMKYLYIWRNLKFKTMKKILLLMIIPMIGFGQFDRPCQYKLDSIGNCPSPTELIEILECAARNKDAYTLEFFSEYQYYDEKSEKKECKHIIKMVDLLLKAEEQESLSNSEIKRLNNFVNKYSEMEVLSMSPPIDFGGKTYIKCETMNWDMEMEDKIFFFVLDLDNCWQIIFHPGKQKKAIYKFFKKDDDW